MRAFGFRTKEKGEKEKRARKEKKGCTKTESCVSHGIARPTTRKISRSHGKQSRDHTDLPDIRLPVL